MVKDHSDSEKGNPLPPHGLLFLERCGWIGRWRGGGRDGWVDEERGGGMNISREVDGLVGGEGRGERRKGRYTEMDG